MLFDSVSGMDARLYDLIVNSLRPGRIEPGVVERRDDKYARHPPGTLVLDNNLQHIYPATDHATRVPGDYLYFKNKDDYVFLTWAKNGIPGFWTGENCIYVGNGKYSGLGLWDQTEAELRSEAEAFYMRDTGKTPFPGNPNIDIRFTTFSRIQINP